MTGRRDPGIAVRWYRVSGVDTGKAHLADPGGPGFALCGMSLDDATSAPGVPRCKLCQSQVRRFAEAALAEPEEMRTDRFLVTVTHPAYQRDPEETIRRKLSFFTTWTVEIEVLSDSDS